MGKMTSCLVKRKRERKKWEHCYVRVLAGGDVDPGHPRGMPKFLVYGRSTDAVVGTTYNVRQREGIGKDCLLDQAFE
jgi:hypothetical protein